MAAYAPALSSLRHWMIKVWGRCDMHSLLKKARKQVRALLCRIVVGPGKGRATQGNWWEKGDDPGQDEAWLMGHNTVWLLSLNSTQK